jgi:hypothetical protein
MRRKMTVWLAISLGAVGAICIYAIELTPYLWATFQQTKQEFNVIKSIRKFSKFKIFF